ncbi:MAG: hypothetical protein H7A45_01750 [Verrucomicrobiales bacterium]|nr:hypothetical protein [Verrucomicrobiales bacterium]
MKTPWEDLENELHRLAPKQPGDRLATRIEARLKATVSDTVTGTRPRALLKFCLPLAAAAVFVALLTPLLNDPEADTPPEEKQLAATNTRAVPNVARPPDATPNPAGSLRRVGEANYLYGAADEGVVYGDGDTPYRRIRYQFLDTSEWQDEASRAVVRVIVPREDVLLLPMNVY